MPQYEKLQAKENTTAMHVSMRTFPSVNRGEIVEVFYVEMIEDESLVYWGKVIDSQSYGYFNPDKLDTLEIVIRQKRIVPTLKRSDSIDTETIMSPRTFSPRAHSSYIDQETAAMLRNEFNSELLIKTNGSNSPVSQEKRKRINSMIVKGSTSMNDENHVVQPLLITLNKK